MDLKRVYEYSYVFLMNKATLYFTKEQLDDFISNPDVKNCDSLGDAYELLLGILQDFNRYPNVIKFAERRNEIKRILHNYDFEYIANLKPDVLLERFKEEFRFEKDSMWLRYTKGVITGAEFMLNFETYDEFKGVCASFDVNDMTREAFALFLSTKITNMGFAIACNWLKELGYYGYAKPDIHTKDVCKTLKLNDSKDSDIEFFESIVKVANESGVEAYKVDKVWWLICTGNFYRYKTKLSDWKDEFLHCLNKEFGDETE